MSSNSTDRFLREQSPLGAIIGGLTGVPLASVTWALVVSIYKLEINILAIAVGFIVGYMVRTLGKGVTPLYGVIGVIFTILGCISGRIISSVILNYGASVATISNHIITLNTGMAFYYLRSTFKNSDLIFYIIALFAGYYCSFRK